MSKFSLSLFIIFIPSFVFSSEPTHLIDNQTNICIEKNKSLLGMITCYHQAEQQWKAELERIYLALMFQLETRTKRQFRKAQQQWTKYKRAEFKAIDAMYYDSTNGGTKWKMFKIKARMEIVKKRVLILSMYLEDFSPKN